MIISKRLKGANSQVANEQFGLSEGDFFLFLIENFPIGSKVSFNQLEREKWIERIQKWGVQMLNRNDFIDYYICAEEFKVVFGKLVEKDPNAVKQIHHFSLVLDGIILIDCLDNFSIVEIEPSFEKLLRNDLMQFSSSTNILFPFKIHSITRHKKIPYFFFLQKMKMILMLAGLSILASSCFKKGCRDIDVINYNEKAKRNDHNCEYYSKMKLSNITVLNFSSVNSSGSPWDSGNDPDCFVKVKDYGNNIMFQFTFKEDQYGELSWDVDPAITITEFTGVTLQMRDYDAGLS